ncbi:MAG TPA: YceD family protein [Quisquiliibacterium sp.]|nr:YceD family protein [Quisquiliibacterium sp.]
MTSKPSERRHAAHPWIDMVEFARSGGEFEAVQVPADFPRLLDLLASDDGRIEWRLSGERRPRPEGGADSFLRLRLSGTASLGCMRCLRPVRVEFGDDRLFKVVLTETQAEREDAETDEYDSLVLSHRFDVLELVEDEAILALPIAPRHDDCSLPAEARGGAEPAEAPAERPNPFAALAGLRARPRGNGQGDGEGS